MEPTRTSPLEKLFNWVHDYIYIYIPSLPLTWQLCEGTRMIKIVRFIRSCHYGQNKFRQTQRQACKYPRQSCESGWLNTRKPELAARLRHLARTPSHPAQSESASDFVGSKVTSGGSKEKAPFCPSPFELRRTAVKRSIRTGDP